MVLTEIHSALRKEDANVLDVEELDVWGQESYDYGVASGELRSLWTTEEGI